jgi:hypothetical protein
MEEILENKGSVHGSTMRRLSSLLVRGIVGQMGMEKGSSSVLLFMVRRSVPLLPSTADCLQNASGDGSDLDFRELGKHGQREKLLGALFGDRKGAAWYAERGIGVLEMDRDRIMNAAANVLFLESAEDPVAVGNADGIHMIDMLSVL